MDFDSPDGGLPADVIVVVIYSEIPSYANWISHRTYAVNGLSMDGARWDASRACLVRFHWLDS